jgi:hypothetical protein
VAERRKWAQGRRGDEERQKQEAAQERQKQEAAQERQKQERRKQEEAQEQGRRQRLRLDEERWLVRRRKQDAAQNQAIESDVRQLDDLLHNGLRRYVSSFTPDRRSSRIKACHVPPARVYHQH